VQWNWLKANAPKEPLEVLDAWRSPIWTQGKRAGNVTTDFETKKIKDWLKPSDGGRGGGGGGGGRETLENFMQWQGKQIAEGCKKKQYTHPERWTLYPESILWGFLAPVAYLPINLQGLFFLNRDTKQKHFKFDCEE
jgi:hypothetical protein